MGHLVGKEFIGNVAFGPLLGPHISFAGGVAAAAFGSSNILEDPSLFYAVAIVPAGQTPETAEQALLAEFERLKDEGVTDHELERAKNQFMRDYIIGRESNEQKALHLAHAAVIHNDITRADAEIDVFDGITKADIARVARAYDSARSVGLWIFDTSTIACTPLGSAMASPSSATSSSATRA